MKQNSKKFLAFLLVLLIFGLTIGNMVKAETAHVFSFYAYDYDPLEDAGTEDEYPDGGNVEPGKVIALDIMYEVGSDTKTGVQIGVVYDSSVVEPLTDEGEIIYDKYTENTNNGGIWPPEGTGRTTKNTTTWNYSSLGQVGNRLNLVVTDSSGTHPLVASGKIATLYFKVLDSATPGTTFKFEYDPDNTMLSYSPLTVREDLELNVYGEVSSNTKLDTLSVKSGTTEYTLTPTFTSGTADKEFSTVVPNSVSSVDIAATMVDPSGTIASGTGANALSVGENTISIIAQAQSGDEETYKVKVYRLNNDATLSSLSLTAIDIGEFKSNVTSYTALVPYSTSTTSVSATPTDSNASINSGSGSWSLTNTGATTNDRDVIVYAENCDSKYSSVPNNSCTQKTYSISITRTAASTNNDLKSLTVDGTSVPSFSASTTEYDIGTVSNATTSVNLQAEVADTNKATITTTLGNKSLAVGDNTLTVTVKSESGATKDYTVKVRRLNNDSKLASLSGTSTPAGSMSPTFSSTFYNYYTYTAPADAEEVTLSATLSDPDNATLNTDLSNPFNIEANPTVNILVTAEDGSSSTYVVKLVRSKSTNNNLSDLSVDGYTISPSFTSGNTNYTLSVPGTVDKVNVSATLADSRATIISGTGENSLSYGPNTIEVKVQAEDNTVKTYKIVVTREKKTISALSDLKVDGASVTGFSETVLEYTLASVPFEKTSVEIEAVLKDSDATVTGDGTVNLSTGDNKLYVTVTAHDGVTKTTYTLNIEREKDPNAYLSDLQIDGTTITGFSKTKNDYTLTVANDKTSLNLTPVTESSAATYIVSGNSGFVTTADNVVTITVTAEKGNINTYTITVTREKSDNNYLSGITLSKGTLSPAFLKTTNSYTASVDRDVENITITPTLEDSSATYTISGPSELAIGDNTFNIVVLSEKGTPNTYSIIVTRNLSSNNYLSDLTLDGTTITGFVKTNDHYEIDVPSTTTSVTLNGTPEESHATVTGTGTFNISTGPNTFEIKVTAENNDEKTYTVVINKLKSTDNTLSALSIVQTSISPTFSPTVTSYTASVAYSVTNIDIVATANDSNATITGDGNKSLTTGNNSFDVVVTAEDGTSSKTYTIVVTRAKNNNAYLTNLVLSTGSLDPAFDPDTTSYTVELPNSEDSISITAYTQDTNATVSGDGSHTLSTGNNIIDVVVTAEDGTTTKTYTLNVDRAKSSDASLKSLTTSSGTLDPTFSPTDKNYAITVNNEVTDVTITATPNSDAATVTVSGNTGLTVGTTRATVTVTAEDGTLDYYYIDITRNPSSNNFLSNLSVTDASSVEYITSFSKTQPLYNITVENEIDKVTISATLEDSSSTMVGDGEKTLSIGDNSFDVVVTSSNNIDRTYTIKVFRKANSNAYLSSLTVDSGTYSPTFNKETVGYTMSVDNSVSDITITAVPEVSTSTVTITNTVDSTTSSGTGTFNLVSGTNTFNIDVQSEDTTTKTYTLTVTKAASSNTYLSSISVDNGTLDPTFNKNTKEYTVDLTNETSAITITAVPEDSTSTVTGDGLKSLNVGANRFEIEVAAEDGVSTDTYVVTVNRAASSVNKLSDLTVDGTTITGFSSDNNNYSLNVPNDKTSVEIGATVLDPTSTVSGLGTKTLSTGPNVITIPVTAEDGSVNNYIITITRAKNSNNYLKKLDVDEGTITPEFNKDTETYNITVPNEITNLTIDAEPEVTTSSVAIEDNHDFAVGDNTVKINVTAEDDSVRTYKIVVNRQVYADNFLSTLTVTDASDNSYDLNPDFNKNTLTYEVGIPSTITSVDVNATATASDSTITGTGTVPITSLPQTQKVVVRSGSGIERTYKINFVRGLSNNNKLLSLSVNPGTLSPAFNKNTNTYNVSLPSSATSITISATADSSIQSMTGTGTFSLSSGTNTFNVIVTAENGSINTYTINVNVGVTSSNKLTSLTVSEGSLDPAFDPDTRLYNVNVGSTISTIDIDATGPNTITGLGTKNLDEGNNIFEVKSIDSDGNENVYRVVVNKSYATPPAISDPDLAYLAVDGYTISPEFTSANTEYSATIAGESRVDVIAVPKDPSNTVTISGNDDLNNNNTITVTVTNTGGVSKTYTISTSSFMDKLKSDVYTLDTYVNRVPINKNVGDFKNEFLNPNEYLKVYDADGTLLSDSELIGTGYTIKLEKDGTVYDSKIIIVLTDLNGDAEVSVADIILIRQYILETGTLSVTAEKAAYVNDDEDIDIADLLLIKKAILEGGE